MAGQILDFPNAKLLQRLMLSENGFIFDPVTGNSFSINPSGAAILQLVQKSLDLEEITSGLQAKFDVDPVVAERETLEFVGLLRKYFS